MIKNERQYRITKTEVEKFRASLEKWDATPPSGVDPIIHAAQKAAIESQLHDLQREVSEYDELRSGQTHVLEVASFEDLPDALVRARIALGLSQKELGERLGLKEQQIQRYEATGYSGASLARTTEVVNALGVRIRKEVFLPSAPNARKTMLQGLKQVGFDREFIESRLLGGGRSLGKNKDSPEGDTLVFQAAERASRILGVSPSALLDPDPLSGNRLLAATRFRVPAGASEQRLTAYTFYAHYLALLLLDATTHLPTKPIPTDPAEVRSAMLEQYGKVDFNSAIRFIWDHGIPVLPLDDPGTFFGACWRAGGRNVIALKRRTPLFARWLQLALHEFRHAGEEPDSPEFSLVETTETPDVRRDSKEEKRANRFAAEVVLDGRAEELVKQCVEETRPKGRTHESGQIELLKQVVPKVAAKAGVPADSLAEYLAYRLTQQGLNWWGPATNLQERGGSPWRVARDIALQRVDFSRLNPIDRDLLVLAFTEKERE